MINTKPVKKPILIIVGPAGSGKTTIARTICEMDADYLYSISDTSRDPRGTEIDGRDYYFREKSHMQLMIERGNFLEHNPNYATHLYGTSKREFGRIQRLGKVPVLDIDYRGAQQIYEKFYGIVPLYAGFIWSPEEVLRARMLARGGLSAQQIDGRLKRFFEEEYPFAKEQLGVGKIFQKIYTNTNDTIISVLSNEFYNDSQMVVTV